MRWDDDLDPADDDAAGSRALLDRLRALPPEGREPSWDRFERELQARLDAEQATKVRPWWRRWWAPAIGLGLAGATAAALLVVPRAERPATTVAVSPDAAVEAPAPTPNEPAAARVGDPLVLTEGELAVDELDDEVLDEVLAALAADDDDDEAPAPDDEVAPLAAWAEPSDEPAEGLVPELGLDWVDELDDDELSELDAWLAEELDERT